MDTKILCPFTISGYRLENDNIIASINPLRPLKGGLDLDEQSDKVNKSKHFPPSGGAGGQILLTILKTDFENWLTYGTNKVAYPLPELDKDNDLTGRLAFMAMGDYWQERQAVILADLYTYLTRSQGSRKEVAAEISLHRSMEDIDRLITLSPYQRSFIYLKMSQYGYCRSMATIEKMLEVR